jgi:hypothetical protein
VGLLRWVPIGELDDMAMREAARTRMTVRLTSGRVATLVKWPGPLSLGDSRKCRLETRAGSRFSVPCVQVEKVAVEE